MRICSFADVVQVLIGCCGGRNGGADTLAKRLKVSVMTIYSWRHRDLIPETHFAAIVEIASSGSQQGRRITLDLLHAFARRRRAAPRAA